jgi:hypothetical protein
MLQALETIWFRFLQKKYLKKFHACVPLSKGEKYKEKTYFIETICSYVPF